MTKFSVMLTAAVLAGCGNMTANPFDTDADVRVPGIDFATPAQPGEAADQTYRISVSFAAVTIADTWSLYYVSDATASKGTLIGENLPVTVRTIDWDTSTRPGGTYYLYGELTSLGSVVTAAAKGSIRVNHSSDANAAPGVTLTSPAGAETYAPGDSIDIVWSGSDADGDSVTYTVEYSSNDGQSWSTLAEDLTGTSYEWVTDSTLPRGMSYRVRVTAEDDDGVTASSASRRPFSIL